MVWRYGVQLGRVQKIDAPLEGVILLTMRLVFRVLLTEGHGAKADGGNRQFAVPEAAIYQCLGPS